jgi:hypothetical protein
VGELHEACKTKNIAYKLNAIFINLISPSIALKPRLQKMTELADRMFLLIW